MNYKSFWDFALWTQEGGWACVLITSHTLWMGLEKAGNVENHGEPLALAHHFSAEQTEIHRGTVTCSSRRGGQ